MNKPYFYILFFLFPVLLSLSCDKKNAREVVIYTSLDQIFSEPILKEFEAKTGIKVKPVYDTEAAKTTGLVNRLIAEKNHPQADVFWNSEISRTIILKNKGILTAYFSPQAKDIPTQFKDKEGYWAGFACRARVLVYNTKLLKEKELPKSIFELTEEKWRGRVALANPLFGTTATHFTALYAALGKEKALDFFKGLAKNVVMVPGNSASRDRVRDGELEIGFTDTDDVYVAVLDGASIDMIFPDRDTLGTVVIPNTIALINNAPHLTEAKMLIDYLLSKEMEEKLAYSSSMQIPVRKNVKRPAHVPYLEDIKMLEIDYENVAGKIEEAAKYLQEICLR